MNKQGINSALPRGKRMVMSNALFVIRPYRYHGTWVFDDDKVGLVREPFVAGMPQIIEHYVKDIPEAEKGFTAIFSDKPFPQTDLVLEKETDDMGGGWYKVKDQEGFRGWLCPALRKYFSTHPDKIYIKVEK